MQVSTTQDTNIDDISSALQNVAIRADENAEHNAIPCVDCHAAASMKDGATRRHLYELS